MIFSFDLISDLHRESWPDFDWEGQPTSPYCIVAGDVARDRALVIDTLERLSEVYQGVFYIDGNDEHKDYAEDLGQSYRELEALIAHIPKVVYLQDNVVVINGIAIVATNAWWSYDFDPLMDIEQSVRWVEDKDNISYSAALAYSAMSYTDAGYLCNSIHKLQTQKDVSAIVIVTHTVPCNRIIQHDLDLIDTWRFNTLGSSHILRALAEDTERKVKTWCFGHYHNPVDTTLDGIRYVSNPRGRGNTKYCQSVYYPKRITVKY
jgi:predicted phosphodiesterase